MLCCEALGVEPGHFLLVTADEQTAGRGQRGTVWESAAGENLTFSVAWRNYNNLPTPDVISKRKMFEKQQAKQARDTTAVR